MTDRESQILYDMRELERLRNLVTQLANELRIERLRVHSLRHQLDQLKSRRPALRRAMQTNF